MPPGLANDITVPWTEHVQGEGPGEIDYVDNEAVARRTIDLPNFFQYDQAARALIGYSKVVRSPAGNRYIARFPPDSFPGIVNESGQPYLYASSIRVRGLAPKGSLVTPSLATTNGGAAPRNSSANYLRARLAVEYHALEYEVLTDQQMVQQGFTLSIPVFPGAIPDRDPPLQNPINDAGCPDEATLQRYVIRRVVPAAQYLTLRGLGFRFVPNGRFIAQGIGKMIVNLNFMLTWKNVPVDGIPCSLINPALPPGTGAIENTMGKVNRPGFGNFYPGTLLLMACEFKALRNRFGIRTFDVSYGFKWQSPGMDTTTYGVGPFANNNPPGFVGNWAAASNGDLLSLINQQANQAANLQAQVQVGAGARSFPAGHNHILDPITNRWTQASITGNDNFILLANGQNPYDWADFNKLFRPP